MIARIAGSTTAELPSSSYSPCHGQTMSDTVFSYPALHHFSLKSLQFLETLNPERVGVSEGGGPCLKS